MEKSRQSPYVDLTKLAYSFNSATVSRTQRSGTVSPNMFELVSYNSSFLVDTATIFLQGTRALLVSSCYSQKAAFPVREQWPNTWSGSGRKHLDLDTSLWQTSFISSNCTLGSWTFFGSSYNFPDRERRVSVHTESILWLLHPNHFSLSKLISCIFSAMLNCTQTELLEGKGIGHFYQDTKIVDVLSNIQARPISESISLFIPCFSCTVFLSGVITRCTSSHKSSLLLQKSSFLL